MPSPTYNRGYAWTVKKDYDKAITDYNEAIRLDPNLCSRLRQPGRAWDDTKDYDKAIADYNEAIRLDPTYAGAYYDRGNAWRNKKNFDKAIADYNEVIRLGSGEPWGVQRIGMDMGDLPRGKIAGRQTGC